MDVLNGVARSGQPVILAPASSTNPGEDFVTTVIGRVSAFVAGGYMSSGLLPLYGSLNVTEFEFAPAGAETLDCLGASASSGFALVSLDPCGVNSKTLWILDPVKTRAGSLYELISGTTASNFQNPPLLTGAGSGQPLLAMPREYHLPAPAEQQQWGVVQGILP